MKEDFLTKTANRCNCDICYSIYGRELYIEKYYKNLKSIIKKNYNCQLFPKIFNILFLIISLPVLVIIIPAFVVLFLDIPVSLRIIANNYEVEKNDK